jgi:hypothetical protein
MDCGAECRRKESKMSRFQGSFCSSRWLSVTHHLMCHLLAVSLVPEARWVTDAIRHEKLDSRFVQRELGWALGRLPMDS